MGGILIVIVIPGTVIIRGGGVTVFVAVVTDVIVKVAIWPGVVLVVVMYTVPVPPALPGTLTVCVNLVGAAVGVGLDVMVWVAVGIEVGIALGVEGTAVGILQPNVGDGGIGLFLTASLYSSDACRYALPSFASSA